VQQRWVLSNIQIESREPDLLDSGYTCRLTLLNDPQGREITTSFAAGYIVGLPLSIDYRELARQAQRALDDQASEERDAAGVESFDLPRDEPIGYIAILGKEDRFTGSGLTTVKYFPKLLARQGYRMSCIPGADACDPLETGDTPAACLRKYIAQYREKGFRALVVYIRAHGDDRGRGMHFIGKEYKKYFGFGAAVTPQKILTAAELKTIIEENRDMTILALPVSCFAGGLPQVLPQIRPLTSGPEAGSVRKQFVLLETSEHTVVTGRASGNGTTLYENVFLDRISNGATIGKARMDAHRAVKRESGYTAESYRITSGGTDRTADVRNFGSIPNPS
jgi:hypothetical protein